MEGLAGAASAFAVVSVAGQLGVGINHLIRFWNSIKNAPSDIQSIGRELKLLQAVLHDIEDAQQQYGPDPAVTDALASCGDQVKHLITLTDGFEAGFAVRNPHMRTWAALKAVLKQDKLKKFQEVLRDTKLTLLLAQQSATRSGTSADADEESCLLIILT